MTFSKVALTSIVALLMTLVSWDSASAQIPRQPSAVAAAVPSTGTLATGHVLGNGQAGPGTLFSPRTEAELLVGPGSLGLYQYVPTLGLTIGIWSTASSPVGVPNSDHSFLAMQGDGNLVLYAASHRVIWSTHTSGTGHHNRLVVQDDGDLVVYTSGNKAVWSSQTTRVVLAPGDVLRGGQRWVAHNSNDLPTALSMQANGNLQLSVNAQVLWSSHTSVHGSYLTVQSNGNLVIRAPNGKGVWASGPVPGCHHCHMTLGQYEISIDDVGRSFLWYRPIQSYFP